MEATGGFIVQYFPLFLLGAVFGKLMEASGRARILADGIIHRLGAARAILAVILCCAVMTYGGVSLAVAALPLGLVIVMNLSFTFMIIPALDTGYLAWPAYGETDVGSLRGVWSIIAALTLSSVALVVLNLVRLCAILGETLDRGAG